MKKRIAIAALASAAVLLAACGQKEPEPTPLPPPAPAGVPATPPATAPAAAPATDPAAAASGASSGASSGPTSGATNVAASGADTFAKACAACHVAGVTGAPKPGDKADWAPRIAQGKDTLYQHAIQGYTGKKGTMPPKGGFTTLSDDEVKAAVDHMVAQAS